MDDFLRVQIVQGLHELPCDIGDFRLWQPQVAKLALIDVRQCPTWSVSHINSGSLRILKAI